MFGSIVKNSFPGGNDVYPSFQGPGDKIGLILSHSLLRT